MNPATPAPGTPLCRLDEINDPGAKGFRFRAGDALFAGFVVRKGDDVRGFVDSCPHTGQPLSMFDDRYLTREGDRIFCTGHGALFRPEDGVCTAGPCEGDRLAAWPVAVSDGEVTVA